MPKMKLTAAAVERIKAPDKGQVDYFDAAFPALALRVSASGVRSWTYFGRVHGKLRRTTLGRFPAMTLTKARQAAGDAADAMRAGKDPVQQKREQRREVDRAKKDTFAAVAADWLKRDQAENRGLAEVKRIIDREFIPHWSGWRLQDISRRDVIEIIDQIADRGAVTMARRAHAHLHRLFKWAVGRGLVTMNPLADLPKPGAEKPRERVLDDGELARVWRAAQTIGYPFGTAVQLLILTGARRDEIGLLRWLEIHDKAIHLAGARTKNGDPHVIPLSALAESILAAVPRINDSDLVFTTNGETAVSGWSRAKLILDRTIAKAELDDDAEPDAKGDPLPAWRIHDLRRTVATGMQKLDTRLEVIEAVLGHTSGSRAGIVGVYQRHTYADEKRKALAAWARQVQRLVQPTKADVVALHA